MKTIAFMLGVWLVLVFVGLCGACTSPMREKSEPKHKVGSACDRAFLVAPEFLPDERTAMQSAIERWNAIAIEQFCLQSSTTPGEAERTDHGVFRVVYGSPQWKQLSDQAGGSDVIGMHWSDTDQIAIIGTSAAEFELIALHEFGHAHGLGHIDPPAIMCAYIGTADDFTPNDIAECERVGACASDAGAPDAEAVAGFPGLFQVTVRR